MSLSLNNLARLARIAGISTPEIQCDSPVVVSAPSADSLLYTSLIDLGLEALLGDPNLQAHGEVTTDLLDPPLADELPPLDDLPELSVDELQLWPAVEAILAEEHRRANSKPAFTAMGAVEAASSSQASSPSGNSPSGRNGRELQQWRPAEDQRIMEGVARHGTRWAAVAKDMPGRSENAIRNRYHRLKGAARARQAAQSAGVTVGGYRCRKCGVFKKGHVCLETPSSPRKRPSGDISADAPQVKVVRISHGGESTLEWASPGRRRALPVGSLAAPALEVPRRSSLESRSSSPLSIIDVA
eukprot:CAMPEP_0185291734 /NCGR_PEP_ID=MMETSP1363-20130426/5550_1 /TAXON_ID=38817 /ORGANISM="Gephyrocapsa oceanica, Strain RCC1303" /LENGTH=299 /DNA_ID=CAMNT_0027887887 /DNA_START=30 /DNA_END=929 /DNA_ORIENTATION=-